MRNDTDSPSAGRPLGRVADLFVYPIKSLGGVRVEQADVGELGLATDRRWMLVDDDGVFLTQRVLARMALVHATPLGAHVDAGVRVTAPSLEAIHVTPPPADASRRAVRIWNDVVEAQAYDDHTSAWFSDAIGTRCHLVFMPDDVRRPVDPTYAGPDDRAAFSDAFPVLLLSRESLDDLNARLVSRDVEPATVRRFRPNVFVEGTSGPFAEDAWEAIAVGDVGLRVAKPCARCVLTTVDPTTAVPSPRGEPLRTLATYRTRNGKVLFAQNALVERAGTVRVGDEVRPAR